jgi:hypothetical protein
MASIDKRRGKWRAQVRRVNGARKTSHVAFEKCTRRRSKSVPQGVIVGGFGGVRR